MPTIRFGKDGKATVTTCCKTFDALMKNGAVCPAHINGKPVAMMSFTDLTGLTVSGTAIPQMFEENRLVLATACPICGEKITFQSEIGKEGAEGGEKTLSTYTIRKDFTEIYEKSEPKSEKKPIERRDAHYGYDSIPDRDGEDWITGTYANIQVKDNARIWICCQKFIRAMGWKGGETHEVTIVSGDGRKVTVDAYLRKVKIVGALLEVPLSVLDAIGVKDTDTVTILDGDKEPPVGRVAVYETLLGYPKSSNYVIHSSSILRALGFKDGEGIRLTMMDDDGEVKEVTATVRARHDTGSFFVKFDKATVETNSLRPGAYKVKFNHL